LQLDDNQKAKLDAIYAGMREKFMALRDAPEGDRQKMAERNRGDLRAQIMDILNPEQKKKYEQIVAEGGDRRGGGGARGRIYVLDEKKQPKPIEVRLGLSDGTTTEVISPDVREGMEVVTGTVQAQQQETSRPRPPTGPRLF
jgi:HlyD family secretion protein